MPRCKVCKEPYERTRPMQVACTTEHALEYAKAQRKRREDKELREAKRRLKTRRQWEKEAQTAFNAYIRERDRELPCISCGRFHQGQWHAGHYLSVGAHPELRFEPANVHKQCMPCNHFKSGDQTNYRIALVNRVGFELVAWLEGPHEPKKYTIEELMDIKQRYTRMRRELEKERL